MSNPTKLTVFLDNIGRIVLGEAEDSAEQAGVLRIKNPAVVHMSMNPQNNQLQLQLLPLFFKDFLANQGSETVWNFNRSAVTLADDFDLTPQLVNQYQHLFGKIVAASSADVVRLFEE